MSENIIQYVSAACNGDTAAMGKLYTKTLKASYFLAQTLCADSQDAIDTIKKTYARAFCNIDKLKRPEAFEIWMKQNVAAAYKEGRKFVFADAQAGAADNLYEFLSESVLDDEEQCNALLEAVAALKPELRTVLVLHYNNGMPVSILAKFFAVSESTANALLSKARESLLAFSGIEAFHGESDEALPVLTRIFQRKAAEIEIDNNQVRDVFIYAIDAYESSKPAAPIAEDQDQPADDVQTDEPEQEEVAYEADEQIQEPEPVHEDSNIISLKQKINEILDGEGIASYNTEPENEPEESEEDEIPQEDIQLDVPAFDGTVDEAALENFSDVPRPVRSENAPVSKPKFDIKNLKLNPKTIGIIAAAVVVLVIICVVIAVVAGGDDKPKDSVNNPSGVNAVASGYEWKAGGFNECTEIVYLDENCCYFKSATTGKYGLLDYQGNVILQPNYDGFSRCGSGRDYSSRGSYHSLVQIGTEYYEFTIAGGTVTVSETPHASHSVTADTLGDTSYDERDRYFEGYAAARKDGKWGYVSQEKDKRVIPYEYEAVNDLQTYEAAACDYCRGVSSGLIAVKKNGVMGIIDLENEIVVPFEYSSIMPGSNGVFIACKSGTWGVILVGNAVASFRGVNIVVDTLPSGVSGNTETPIGSYTVSSSDGANVRSDAGADYDLLGELEYGDTVEGYATKNADNGNEWLCIKYNGEYAWVAMNNLEPEGV